MDTKMGPRIFERHLHVTRYRSRALSDFRVGELKTALRARQRNVKRLTIEVINHRLTSALHNARYVYLRGSAFEVRFKINWQEQRLAKFRARGCKDGKMIAQRFT